MKSPKVAKVAFPLYYFYMKPFLGTLLGASTIALMTATALAAGANLYNGGFGQVSGNTQNFGVAVCNGGTKAVTQSVPVSVTVNGSSAQVFSASSIEAQKCEYSYLSYGQLGMQAGKSYEVSVTIDPQRSFISNTNNQTSYGVTVPAAQTAQTNAATNETANANAQSGNIFSAILNWIIHLFGGQ